MLLPLKSMLLGNMDIRHGLIHTRNCFYYTVSAIPIQNNIDFRVEVPLLMYLIGNVPFFVKIPNIMTMIVWSDENITDVPCLRTCTNLYGFIIFCPHMIVRTRCSILLRFVGHTSVNKVLHHVTKWRHIYVYLWTSPVICRWCAFL